MRNLIYAILSIALLVTACSVIDEPSTNNIKQESTGRFISPEEAYGIAINAFSDFDFTTKSRRFSPASVILYDKFDGGRSSADEVDSTFYVVNFLDGGFAVIAGAKNIETPVFAISEEGKFDVTDVPNAQFFMEIGRELYSTPWDTSIVKPEPIQIPIDSTISYVNRYVPTIWGQGYPYNYYCPRYTNGQQAPVGCGPLAIGQIMAFHRFPESFVFTYSDSVTTERIYLDWEKITACNNLLDLEEVYTDAAYNVKMLLRNIGITSYAKYEPKLTPSRPSLLCNALKKYGFKAVLDTTGDYNSWLESLVEDGPLLMAGYNDNGITAHDQGHGWVVDALKKIEFFFTINAQDHSNNSRSILAPKYYIHINWGFDGKANGYFLYDAVANNVQGEKDGKNIYYERLKCITRISPK